LFQKSCKALLLLGLITASLPSHAWNAAGHQLMSAISWDLMTSKQQDYWVDILKHHPRFKQDFEQNIPKQVKKNPRYLNEWIFRQAARWSDLPRNFQPNLKEKYHHGSWHYINYPLYLDKKVNTKFLNLNSNFKGKLHNHLNSIQALKGNLAILSKQGATKRQKAIALCWVLHLVGDSHQPLHSTALFDKRYFPKGDRGGNLIKIKGQGRVQNLHWYWDSRLDNTTSFRIIDLKAKKLGAKYKKQGLKNQAKTIASWSKKTNKIAIEKVYTKQVLKPHKQAKKHRAKQPTVTINAAYDKNAREVAEKQIVNAAYQLVYLLSSLSPF